MAAALVLLNVERAGQYAAPITAQDTGLAVVGGADTTDLNEVRNTLSESVDAQGNLKNLIIDDVVIGAGDGVEEGDIVTVHYVGRLQNGTEFDNSYNRGEPFSFKVGAGRVIEGWDLGVVGMQIGGQRILVIPPQLAYGAAKVGPIPANSTLVFAIELLEIN